VDDTRGISGSEYLLGTLTRGHIKKDFMNDSRGKTDKKKVNFRGKEKTLKGMFRVGGGSTWGELATN